MKGFSYLVWQPNQQIFLEILLEIREDLSNFGKNTLLSLLCKEDSVIKLE